MATKQDQNQTTGIEAGDGEALPALAADPMVALFEHWQGLTAADDAETQERILRSIISAKTPHDLLNAGESTPARELLKVPIRITGIRASESDYDAGVDWFLHIDAELLANGDKVTVSCGARDVCIKLVKADLEGWLPLDAMFEQATKPTKAGFYPMFLRELPPDF
jgi:hypothetical protein